MNISVIKFTVLPAKQDGASFTYPGGMEG